MFITATLVAATDFSRILLTLLQAHRDLDRFLGEVSAHVAMVYDIACSDRHNNEKDLFVL